MPAHSAAASQRICRKHEFYLNQRSVFKRFQEITSVLSDFVVSKLFKNGVRRVFQQAFGRPMSEMEPLARPVEMEST